MDAIEQVKKAILQIEERLFERIPVQSLAHEVFASKFHFHRLFRKITGSTVHQYILNRKLSEASKMLLESPYPIAFIADKIGFESHEGFCRAFKNRLGVSPSLYRKTGQRFSLMPALDLETGSLRCGVIQELREVSFSGVLLAGIDVHGYSRDQVTEAWFQLLSNAKNIPFLTDKWDSYGVLHGNTWDHEKSNYCYSACKQVTKKSEYPNGIHAIEVPAGIYMQALVRGRRKEITDFYRDTFRGISVPNDTWIIEYQDENFLSPEISPRTILIGMRF